MKDAENKATLQPEQSQTARRLRLPIDGMTCAACATRIERRLRNTTGVSGAAVNYATEEAVVDVSGETTTVRDLLGVVRDTGYDVRRSTTEIRMQDGWSVREAEDAAKRLLEIAGVLTTSIADGVILVETVSGFTDYEELYRKAGVSPSKAVTGLTESPDALREAHQTRYEKLLRRFVAAALLSTPVVIISMSHGALGFTGDRWVMLLLTLPVVFWCGSVFITGAWRALKHGGADMNTLVAMGVLSALAYSVVATVAPSVFSSAGHSAQVYYEAAAVIVTLILLGRVLEEKAKGRTSEAISRLVGLQPEVAHLLRNGRVEDVDPESIVVGQHVQIRPGERIPLDGEIIEGTAAIDESALTGEPIPSDKAPGSTVLAGTVCRDGSVTVRVTRVGASTVLSQIVRLVQEAQAGKAPIQRLADRVAGVFVPSVIVVATIAAVVWLLAGPAPAVTNAVLRFVTVLIISCPCALGLATPTAIMVATGRAASLGILIRDGAAVETVARVDTMLLDKTGTITSGRPAVAGVVAADGQDPNDVLRLAAAVESRSEHPLARAIVDYAARRDAKHENVVGFASFPGLGVSANVGGRQVAAGRYEFVQARCGTEAGLRELAGRVSRDQTAVYVEADGNTIGAVLLSDQLRPSSVRGVANLRELNIEVIMVTGDRQETADTVGEQVGIRDRRARLLPQEKAAVVDELRRRGRVVGMVGDGINDAPALARANVGISLGGGTDIAIEASDVAIMRDDLGVAADAIRLSRFGLRVIKQNLFFAFVYNVVLIPVAAGVLYPLWGILLSPIFASAAMALSSVSVVTNSLRLRRFS